MGRRLADRGAEERALNEPPSEGLTRAQPLGRARRLLALARRAGAWLTGYFRDNDPTFWISFTPALIVSALLFVRSPASNYIFDEQEALLANPYVNGHGLRFLDAFKRDFWGLPPERSIGSYRPIPNLIWRTLWHVSEAPWLHHWVNVVVHAVNAALLCTIVLRITERRGVAWFSGACFLTSAVLTEAIAGVVGIADVLGGLGVLLALGALGLQSWLMPLGVFGAVSFGLFSKESVIVAVPLLAWASLVSAPALHARPLRLLRALLALLAALAALVSYTYVRRHYFPIALPDDLRVPPPNGKIVQRALWAFLRWFQQPRLPQDPINNPLAEADFPHRVAGALRVYLSGLGQIAFPWRLSGDYSYPQEPVPEKIVSPVSVAGALALVGPVVLSLLQWWRAVHLERRGRPWREAVLLAIGLLWVPIAYFPHSNIPVLLPTVRAERFWYLPMIGAAMILGVCLARLARWAAPPTRASSSWRIAPALSIAIFFAFQALRARQHALDYTDDLSFWRATRDAAPNSAKAHLNYSVMLGARGRLAERLQVSEKALELAPLWPMAHVYYGDTLCRLKRATEAYPHYVRGFELAPNDPNLIALGLQCLWDEKAIEPHKQDLMRMVSAHPGSWLAYLANDIVQNGAKHGGVEKKYRPRGYDEGPKP